jgi:hypothetical protein
MTPAMKLIREIEAELRPQGVSVARVCREAALDRTIWHRWKMGEALPRRSSWQAARAVLLRYLDKVPEEVPAPVAEAA